MLRFHQTFKVRGNVLKIKEKKTSFGRAVSRLKEIAINSQVIVKVMVKRTKRVKFFSLRYVFLNSSETPKKIGNKSEIDHLDLLEDE